MKKSMTAVAACLIAGMVSAQISSQNVVGYYGVELNQSYTMIGIGMDPVGGGAGIDINTAFPTNAAYQTKNNTQSLADNILIPNGVGGYNNFYLHKGKSEWRKFGETTRATVSIAPGTAAWYVKRTNDVFSITVAGQAANDPTRPIELNQPYTMLANPYPANMLLNGCFPTNALYQTKNNTQSLADNILIPNGVGGYNNFYLHKGKSEWRKFGETVRDTTSYVPAGVAAWYVKRTNEVFTISVERPYASLAQ